MGGVMVTVGLASKGSCWEWGARSLQVWVWERCGGPVPGAAEADDLPGWGCMSALCSAWCCWDLVCRWDGWGVMAESSLPPPYWVWPKGWWGVHFLRGYLPTALDCAPWGRGGVGARSLGRNSWKQIKAGTQNLWEENGNENIQKYYTILWGWKEKKST